MVPNNTVDITDPELAAKVERLVDWLEDYDDTQAVFHNANLPESEDEED